MKRPTLENTFDYLLIVSATGFALLIWLILDAALHIIDLIIDLIIGT